MARSHRKKTSRRPATAPSEVRRRSLAFLDWPVVLERLAGHARSSRGLAACHVLPLAETVSEAEAALAETTEMVTLRGLGEPPGLGFPEIEPLLAGTEKGAVLSPEELGQVAGVAEVSTAARRYFVEHETQAPRLGAVAVDLTPLADLARRIRHSFDTDGRIRSSVSPELARLRRDRERLATEIQSEMERLKREDQFTKVLQDDYITIRGDRFVLPLKASARSMELGIVHDTSRTGETIFVEPTALVDRNNRLKVTELELQRESRRILEEIASAVNDRAADLRRNMEVLTRLDVINAKAALSMQLEATPPTVLDDACIDLPGLRHPLLTLKSLDDGREVIPNDLLVQPPQRTLVITGPNAGGKTVLLKASALAALMARVGLHVAAAPGCRIGIFDPVLADIGDQQTVLGDLSTFSAHLENLSTIVAACTDDASQRPLVLLDELFVGTNPEQGAALARATLEFLVRSTGGLILVTTHYDALKALAATDEGFGNAAMEFDPDQLRPTFRLAPGAPGRSYAYDIARRFGLPEEILEEATALTQDATRGLEGVIARLEEQEREMIRRHDALQRAQDEVERTAHEHRVATERLEATRREIRDRYEAEMSDTFRDAREQIRAIVAEAQRAGTSRAAESARRRVVEIEERVAEALPEASEAPPDEGDAADLRVGARVHVRTLSRDGTITEIDRNRVHVAVGSFTIEVPPGDLAPPHQKQSRPPRTSSAPVETESVTSSTEYSIPTSGNSCDLRGLRVDDALDEVERYLDEAAVQGKTPVFLIHGHGTGALKKAVREYVASSDYVQRWRAGEPSQGGDGVTVVDLH